MGPLAAFVFRHRRLLTAGFAGLAVLAALAAVTQDPPGRDVLVTARDLPSGHVIGTDDLTQIRVVGPDAAETLDASVAVGRTVAGPMASGELVTGHRAIDPRDTEHPVATITVDPAVGRVIRPGDTVDVLAVPDDHGDPVVVASAVEVVVVDESGDLTVLGLAVERATAVDLAATALDSRLTAVGVAVAGE